MVAYTLLAGGYTSFITTLLFTPPSSLTANDATLKVLSTSKAGTNPSWLQLSPFNESILYATNEAEQGALLAFAIATDGKLTQVASASSGGGSPAYAAAITGPQGMPASTGENRAVVLNYNTGNGAFVRFGADFKSFDESKTIPITFDAPAGGVSHPHHSIQYGNEVLVVDLGADKIWRLAKGPAPDAPYGVTGFIPQPLGSGPRRAIISTNNNQQHLIYTLHEKANTLTSQMIPDVSSNATLTQIPAAESLSIIPSGVPTIAAASYAGAELLSPMPNQMFPKEYLYASNRNVAPNANVTNPEGDAIAIFSTNPLKLVNQVFTGLNQVRGMEFFGENNEYLVAGGLGSGGVAVFRRLGDGGNLQLVTRNTDDNALGRTGFVWAKSANKEVAVDPKDPATELRQTLDPTTHGDGGSKSFMNAAVSSTVASRTLAGVVTLITVFWCLL